MGRRPTWPPPIYPKSPRPGQRTFARVYVAGRARDIPLGPHGSEEARAAYRRLLLEMENGNGAPQPSASLTVAAAVARWMFHAEQTYSAAGREVENHRLSLGPLLRLYGPTPAAEFDARKLEIVQRAMASGSWMSDEERADAEKRKDPIGWCRNVVNRRIVRIQTAWQWIEKEGMTPKGSHANLKTLRSLARNAQGVRNTPRIKPAFWTDVESILPHIQTGRKSRPAAAMLQLQWMCGMRSCEVRLMRTVDIDRSGEVWIYRPEKHKNDWREDGQGRAIPLGPECQRILEGWLQPNLPEAYIFRPSPGSRNECYRPDGYAQVIRRACIVAGVRFTPYCLRHGRKMDITKREGADAARALLGHKSIQTTAHYGSLDQAHAEDVARRLG